MKKYQKQLVSLLAGGVLGYLVYYHFFMDVILLIAHEGFLYMIINIAMLLPCPSLAAPPSSTFWKNGS